MGTVSSGIIHGGRGAPPGGTGDGGGSGSSPDSPGSARRTSFTGLWIGLAAIVMFFAAFTSVFVVLRFTRDWVHTALPGIMWWNTGALLLSSGALELARRALRGGRRTAFNVYWTAGTALGVLFLVGQYIGWRELLQAGVQISSNPSGAFLYIFTATHAAHIMGGVVALVYVNFQALRLRLGPGKRTIADLSAIYWHFVDGIWIYLLAILAIWG